MLNYKDRKIIVNAIDMLFDCICLSDELPEYLRLLNSILVSTKSIIEREEERAKAEQEKFVEEFTKDESDEDDF